jgi:flagellar basal-body rod modification protein FlgD
MISEIGMNPMAQRQVDRNTSGILDKDDFLKLLIMQLRHQDPLSPLEGTEFAAQLAHFSSVEQLSNINTNLLHSIDANFILSQSINNALSATFIGQEVRAATNMFQYSDGENVSLGYTLKSPAGGVTVNIYDEAGNHVRTIQADASALNQGDNTLIWDGRNDGGKKVGDGRYTFTVEAKSVEGAGIASAPFIFGTVTGVRFKENGTFFTVNGLEVALSDIEEIRKG